MSSPALSVAFVYDDSLDRHGGIPQYLATLGRGLVSRGHRVSYLVGSSSIDRLGTGEVHSLARNVDVRFNGSCGTMPLLSRRRDIDKALSGRAFDVVHVQVPYSPFLAARVIHRLDPAVAVVGTFHVNSELALPRAGARLLATMTRRSLRRFDEMMCVSEVAAGFARRWFGLTDTRLVPNMVDGGALRSMATMRHPWSSTEPHVVFVGNLVPRKGVETLLEAMPAIVAAHADARLTIAGAGPLRAHLERLVRNRDLETYVRFAGSISEAEKATLLGSADIACFPSRYGESFGIVLLEAIAAGANVVVAGRNAAYAEVLRETPTALANPDDADDLARTMLRFLAEPDLRHHVAARQRRVAARHDLEIVVDRVLGVYSAALRRRRSPQPVSLQVPTQDLECQPS